MSRTPDTPDKGGDTLRERLIGLGEHSHRKSYYPQLQRRLEELERFKAFLDHSNDAIFLLEVPDASIIDINEASSSQLGWERDELLGRSIFDLSELGLNAGARELIGSATEGAWDRALVETTLHRRNGERFPAEVTLSRLVFQERSYVIAVARDIAKRKEAEVALAERIRMAELGAEIGVALTRGGSLEATLQRCAELLVDQMEAAFGRIWIVSKEDPMCLELKASAGIYTRTDGRHSIKRLGEEKVGLIAQQRKPYLTNKVLGDPGITDQDWARREGMVAFAGYPLTVKDRLVGVVALFFRRPMTKAVLTALASVADAVAVGIERQRSEEALWESEMSRLRLQTQLELAAQIQAKLLPDKPPAVPGFRLAARCLPAHQVGGDFYDWQITGPAQLTLTLGDVMGKGIGAALLMATVRASFRAVAQAHLPVVASLYLAQQALCQDLDNSESFVTLFHARLDAAQRRMTYVDCGHGLVFLRRADGRVEELQPRGLPLGVPTAEAYREGVCRFDRGDTLVLYSDGLPDALPEPAPRNEDLAQCLAGAADALEMVQRLTGLPPEDSPRPDDLTVLVVQCCEGN